MCFHDVQDFNSIEPIETKKSKANINNSTISNSIIKEKVFRLTRVNFFQNFQKAYLKITSSILLEINCSQTIILDLINFQNIKKNQMMHVVNLIKYIRIKS